MDRHLYLSLILLSATVFNVQSQYKMKGSDLLYLNEYTYGTPIKPQIKKSLPGSRMITITVTVETEENVENLRKDKFEVVSTRGCAAILRIESTRLDELSRLPYVKRISISRKGQLTTDIQRSTTCLDQIDQYSTPDGLPLTGKGVLTGIFDQGFDIQHINFLDDQGNPRIKKMFYFTGDDGSYWPINPASSVTDDEYMNHGTHVLGIMAGGYKGELQYGIISDDNAKEGILTMGVSPFYGVAPESTIAVACGQLYMPNILTGIEKIIEYGKSINMPTVINLSIGTQLGAHDGLDPESVYLSELGKDAIIVMAAGNDGLKNNCITFHFSEDDNGAATLFLPNYGSGYNQASGQIDIWGSDDYEYEVDLVIYDLAMRRIVKSFPLKTDTQSEVSYLTTSDLGNFFGDWHDQIFDHNFVSSYIGYVSGVNEGDGRFNLFMQYDFTHARTNSYNKLMGIVVRGNPGSLCNMYNYSEDTEIGSGQQEGWLNATSDGTINDMACADNVLVVGSYNNRDKYSSMTGMITNLPHDKGMDTVGDISGFSSYGSRLDGVTLPHVCAPGAGIISSYSSPYVDAMHLTGATLVAQAYVDQKQYWWGVESGTSMSTPFVSGVVALWLQANPSLGIEQIKETIANTSIKDEFVERSNEITKWGAGKINPLGGLEYIMQNFTSVGQLSIIDNHDFIILPASNEVKIYNPCGQIMSVSLYSIDGCRCVNEVGESNLTIYTDELPSGVYVLQISDEHKTFSQKILIK